MAKYIVKVGSLNFELGSFSRGDVIDVPAERAAKFDPNDIQLIPDNIEETAALTVVNKKRVAKKNPEAASLVAAPVVEAPAVVQAEEPQTEPPAASEATPEPAIEAASNA